MQVARAAPVPSIRVFYTLTTHSGAEEIAIMLRGSDKHIEVLNKE
jgi:hypothetical protein